jgi:TetR/AcrR family transcriptional regulator
MSTKNPELTTEREDLILKAAHRRFITYGYSKVTMDEIAEDIGMGKASLYYYFPTKDDIFRRIIEREQGVFIGQMRDALAKKIPASAKLRTYFRHRVNYSSQLFNLSWHSRQLWPSMKPMFKDLFENLALEEEKLLTQLLRDGKHAKEFNIPSCEKLAQLIIHILQGLRTRLFHTDQMMQTSESVYQILEKETALFIDLLLYGISGRPHD